MDLRRIIFRGIVFLSFCVYHFTLNAQIKNKCDFYIKYLQNNTVSQKERSYVNNIYGYNTPAVLGNLKSLPSYEIGLLYSGYSNILQPGLIFTKMNYREQKLSRNI